MGAVGVDIERLGAVAVATIDRQPARNALDPPALRALTALLTEARADPATRVIVLTGAGSVSFSSGMDLRSLRSGPDAAGAVGAFRDALTDPDRVPLLAAVNGMAIGGGFELVLHCDLAVAASHAVFGLPEVRRGMVPGGGGTLLPTRIPLAMALEIGLVGEPVTAARARELGLVNRVVEPDGARAAALALAEQVAANGPIAVAATRRLMWSAVTDGAGPAWAATQAAYRDPAVRAETEEGIAAFLAKRTPSWASDGPSGGPGPDPLET